MHTHTHTQMIPSRPGSAKEHGSDHLYSSLRASLLARARQPRPPSAVRWPPPPASARPIALQAASTPLRPLSASPRVPARDARTFVTAATVEASNSLKSPSSCSLFHRMDSPLAECGFDQILNEFRSVNMAGPIVRCCCEYHRVLIARCLAFTGEFDLAKRWYASMSETGSFVCHGEVDALLTLEKFLKHPTPQLADVLLDVFDISKRNVRASDDRLKRLLISVRGHLLQRKSMALLREGRLLEALSTVCESCELVPQYCESSIVQLLLRFVLSDEVPNGSCPTIQQCTNSAHVCVTWIPCADWIATMLRVFKDPLVSTAKKKAALDSLPQPIAQCLPSPLLAKLQERLTGMRVRLLRDSGEHVEAARLDLSCDSASRRKDPMKLITALLDMGRHGEAFACVQQNSRCFSRIQHEELNGQIVNHFAAFHHIQSPMINSKTRSIEVRKQYRKICAEWHPDKWRQSSMSEEERSILSLGFNILTTSYKKALHETGSV